MKNIVACFYFSEVTSEVVEMASALSTALGTKLYLLHVVMAPQSVVTADVVAVKMRRAREAINELREPLVQHGVDVSTILLEEHASAVRAILEECEELDTSLIVMGTHGHGALYRALVGSTAEGVMRKAKCPVLLVPSRAAAKVKEVGTGSIACDPSTAASPRRDATSTEPR